MSSGEPTGGDAARLQPPREDSTDVESDLRRIAETDDHLARLAGDRDLVDELRREHFTGPMWERAAEELVRYGVAVLTAWMLKGKIYHKCAAKGRAIPRAPEGALDYDEAFSIAGEVAAVALHHFRSDVLLPGRWDPARGASLTTYFTGQCILRFPNVWRAWVPRDPAPLRDEDALSQMARPDSVEDDVIRSLMAAEALQQVRSPQARKAFVMLSLGMNVPQIAERLGVSTHAVESAIAYARRTIRRPRESA